MNEKVVDSLAKAKSPMAWAGGVVGGGGLIGLLVSMGVSNNTLLTNQTERVERMERSQQSMEVAMGTGMRRLEAEMDDRFRPLEIQASKGDRFTGRDGEVLEKRIDALERYTLWRATPARPVHQGQP